MRNKGGRSRGAALAVGASLLALAGAHGAFAEVGNAPDTPTWVTDGPVYSIARLGDRTYIGGDFSYVGPRTGAGVQIAPVGHAQSGKLVPALGSFPDVSGGRVKDAVAAPDGSWYIGGDFTHVGGEPRSGLARIVTGTAGELALDPTFAPVPAGSINALALGATSTDAGVLYVGGDFGSLNGSATQRNLAAIDRFSGALAGAMVSPDAPVADVGVLPPATGMAQSVVFVAGDFTKLGTTASTQLAAVWGMGAGGTKPGNLVAGFTVSTTWTGVRAVHVGKATVNGAGDAIGAPVYLGGDFGFETYKFSIKPSDGTVAATDYRPDSNSGSGFACAGCKGSVRTIETSRDGSTVYIGGRFTQIFATARANLAAFDAVGDVHKPQPPAFPPPVARPWQPDPDGAVRALAPSDGPLYVGGDFAHVHDASGSVGRRALAALSPASSAAVNDAKVENWDPVAVGGLAEEGTVTALAASAGGVYAGGSFVSVGANPQPNVAALDASGAHIEAWAPEPDGPVYSLAAGNDRVYLGGDFTDVSGHVRKNLAAVGAAGGDVMTDFDSPAEPPCEGAGCTAGVFALALRDAVLYVGGRFGSLGGATRTNAGAVDALTGVPSVGWAPNPDGTVHTLLPTCGTVYIGGSFSQVAGAQRSRLASVDPVSGAATDWNPAVESGGTVYALARDLGIVYVGGNFSQVGGKVREDLAAVDAQTGAATPWNPDVPRAGEHVRALAAPPGADVVYAGGRFSRAGRADRSNLAAFDRAAGDALGWNPGADGPVRVLWSDASSLLVGGAFRHLAVAPQHGFGTFGLGSGGAAEEFLCAPPPEPVPEPEPEPEPAPAPAPIERPAEPFRDLIAPQLTGARLTNKRFGIARLARTAARRRRVPAGTAFRYTLSEPAVVRFSFARRHRVRCRAALPKRPCYRWRKAGSIRHLSPPGASKVRFDGRVARRWLRAGHYRVALLAVDPSGNRSKPNRLTFTVVRR